MPVALVTGASRGVGRGVATSLHEAGFKVFATGRSIQAAELPEEVVRLRCDHLSKQETSEIFPRIAGETSHIVISPVFPLAVGNGSLDAGASQTVRIVLKVPLAVKQFELEEMGSFADVEGVLGFYVQEQNIIP